MLCVTLAGLSPSAADSPDSEAAQAVLTLIKGIADYRVFFAEDESLFPILWRYWTEIVVWLRHTIALTSGRDLDDTSRAIEPSRETVLCARVLEAAAIDDQFLKHMLDHPSGVDLVVHLWIVEATAISKGAPSSCEPHAILALNCLLGTEESCNLVMSRLTALGRTPDEVAKIALGCVRPIAEKDGPISHQIFYIHIALRMCSVRCPLQDATIRKRGVLIITEAVAAVAKRNLKLDGAARTIVGQYLCMLHPIIRSLAHGIPRVIEALRGGLLDIVCRSSTAVESFDEGRREDLRCAISDIISTLIPQYLVFHSVISAAVSAFRKLNLDVIKKTIDQSAYREEWEHLEFLCLERFIFSQVMGRVDDLDGKQLHCDNVSTSEFAISCY